MIGQVAEEETAERASKPKCIRITLAISKAPSGKVIRREIVREEAVSSSKSDSVTQNCATDGISCAGRHQDCTPTENEIRMLLTRTESSTLNDGFRVLGLQANIQLEVVDVAIEFFGRLPNFIAWVPLLEVSIDLQAEELNQKK